MPEIHFSRYSAANAPANFACSCGMALRKRSRLSSASNARSWAALASGAARIWESKKRSSSRGRLGMMSHRSGREAPGNLIFIAMLDLTRIVGTPRASRRQQRQALCKLNSLAKLLARGAVARLGDGGRRKSQWQKAFNGLFLPRGQLGNRR